MNQETKVTEIRSKLLKNLERTFNHVEFGRQLHNETIAQDIMDLSKMIQLSKTSISKKTTNCNVSFIYKEALKLFADDCLHPMVRFDFSRWIQFI